MLDFKTVNREELCLSNIRQTTHPIATNRGRESQRVATILTLKHYMNKSDYISSICLMKQGRRLNGSSQRQLLLVRDVPAGSHLNTDHTQ